MKRKREQFRQNPSYQGTSNMRGSKYNGDPKLLGRVKQVKHQLIEKKWVETCQYLNMSQICVHSQPLREIHQLDTWLNKAGLNKKVVFCGEIWRLAWIVQTTEKEKSSLGGGGIQNKGRMGSIALWGVVRVLTRIQKLGAQNWQL